MIPVTAAAVMWRKRQKETEMGRIYMDLYGVRLMIVNLGALVLFVPVWILVTQMILRIPLLGYLKTNWEWFMILPYSHYFIYMAIAAFSAGVFEETERIVGLGVLRKGKTSWMDAVAFGLGHGGIEAVWIGVIGVLPNVLNEDSSISVAVLLSGAERFCAMAVHILLTLVIMEGIRRYKKLFYWLIAVVLHGLYDFSIAFQNTILIWGVLIFGVVAAMIALIFTKRKWKEERGTRQ